ncbi:MAG: tRNA pseudouridine(38-40) synthase TruA [Chlamydiae bacterium]|nr:tRNA pseudouridine(38-40) synthase TruA [Chlamydiota bacterium]MBI3277677.1 tRNA pseudouridine(38-40) synthase TruA [Chlamydiota bacterium]
MRNFKMVLAYDGTNYSGWQIQKGALTIEEVLEKAIHAITREKVRVMGSGRTDAGVHALGQVAHFRSKTQLSPSQLKRAVNSKLPSDIRILKLEEVPLNFHAQYWVKTKIYRYQIWNGEELPVFERDFLLYHPEKLDVMSMKRASRLLLGRHDFSSFGVNRHLKGGRKENSVRMMKKAIVKKKGFYVTIELEADGFLYKMVRSIVGTLLAVGEGKLTPDDFKKILSEKNRSSAGQTAPPQGLFLVKVKY